jgi:hypothetical protein
VSATLAAAALLLPVSAEGAAASLTLALSGFVEFEDMTDYLVRRDQGEVLCPDTTTSIGQYLATRTLGEIAGAVAETITLVFADGSTLTLQGGGTAIVGESTGVVSAAAARFALLRNQAYSAQLPLDYSSAGSLTIDELGKKSVDPCR